MTIDLTQHKVDVAAAEKAGACCRGMEWADANPNATLQQLFNKNSGWAGWYTTHVLEPAGEYDLADALYAVIADVDWWQAKAIWNEMRLTDRAKQLLSRLSDIEDLRALHKRVQRYGNDELLAAVKQQMAAAGVPPQDYPDPWAEGAAQ